VIASANRLLAGGGELRGHVGERSLELRTERVDDGDDGYLNAGRDQAVFDCSGAGFVIRKTLHQFGHQLLPCFAQPSPRAVAR
jgi:hypothetical protein